MTHVDRFALAVKHYVGRYQLALPTIHLKAVAGGQVTDLRPRSDWLRRMLLDGDLAATRALHLGVGQRRDRNFYASAPEVTEWLPRHKAAWGWA